MCDPLHLNFLVFFTDKMNFCNGITSWTILTLIKLYSGIFYTTFLTTRRGERGICDTLTLFISYTDNI